MNDNNQNNLNTGMNLGNSNGFGGVNDLNAQPSPLPNDVQSAPFNPNPSLNGTVSNPSNDMSIGGLASINNIPVEPINNMAAPVSAPIGGLQAPMPAMNAMPNLDGSAGVGVTPPVGSENNAAPKKGHLKVIVIALIILVGGLLAGGYFYISTPKFMTEVAIDKLFNTTENILLDFEDFNSGYDASKDYEIINNIKMDTNMDDVDALLNYKDFSVKTISHVSDDKLFTNLTLNHNDESVISADVSLEDDVIKLLLDCYDDILVASPSDFDLEDTFDVERIKEMRTEFSVDNFLYINEFMKNTLKESIDYDNIVKEKEEVTLNNETMNVTAYNYKMSINDTFVIFADAIKNDSTMLTILSIGFDMSESEIISAIDSAKENASSDEQICKRSIK